MHVTFADIFFELGANQDRSRGSVLEQIIVKMFLGKS